MTALRKPSRYPKFALLFLGISFLPGIASAQSPAESPSAGLKPQIMFTLDFPGQPIPRYKISLTEDGQGSYDATGGRDAQARVSFSLGAAAAEPLFSLARQLQFFRGQYAASRKVAFMGTKTFRYSGSDGSGETTFTYTENKKLVQLTSNFQALALTLQLGQQLLADARFNRMAVDRDMVELKDSLARHTAAYPQAISSVLAVLTDDTNMVAPVRRDAGAILQSVGTVN
jgi:hypothetical protein